MINLMQLTLCLVCNDLLGCLEAFILEFCIAFAEELNYLEYLHEEIDDNLVVERLQYL